MTISLKVAGTSYTLTQAQLRSLVHTTQANAPARLSGQIFQSAIPDCAWAAGDSVELWVDGTRRFSGWLGPVEMGCDAGRSYVSIQAEDILGRLRGTTFTRYGAEIVGYDAAGAPIYAAGASRQSAVTLFSGQLSATDPVSDYYQYTYSSSSAAQIAEVIGLAAQAYPGALGLGTITGLSTTNLPEKVTDMDCLSVLLRCLALRPDAVLWVDPSGPTPLLHAAVRSALTPVSVSVAPGNTAVRAWSCRDRSDRLLEYLEWRLQYTYKEYTHPSAPDKGVITQPVELLYTYGDGGAPADKRHERRFQLGAYAPVYASGAAAAAQLGTPIFQLPFFAAADYWSANSVLHYEGVVTLYEPAGCTYAWSLGQTLSLTGAAGAYESANALVRGCTYDIVSGQTSIDFGPPDQLGPGDLLNGASSLGSLTIGGITPSTADTHAENPAQSDPTGNGNTSTQDPADTLTQRIQDKLGSFALLAGTGFLVATMDLNTEIHGFAEYSGHASTPPRAYKRHFFSGSGVNQAGITCTNLPSAAIVVTPTASGYTYSGAVGASFSDGRANRYNGDFSSDHRQPHPCGWDWFGYYQADSYTEATKETVIINAGVWYYGYWSGGPLYGHLEDEDNDHAALARAKAAAAWSGWAAFTNTINGGAATWQTVRTTGWTTTAHAAKIKGTIRSNIYSYSCRVTIPLYRYPIGGSMPTTPTSYHTADVFLEYTPENIAEEGHAAVWQYIGVGTMPEWEMPCEVGYITQAGLPVVSLL